MLVNNGQLYKFQLLSKRLWWRGLSIPGGIRIVISALDYFEMLINISDRGHLNKTNLGRTGRAPITFEHTSDHALKDSLIL